ncbi:MAG: oligosaccharide flippase family protein [Candidatus Anstonellaceae archaeon]
MHTKNLSVVSTLIFGFLLKSFSFFFAKAGSLIFYLLILNFTTKSEADIFFTANSLLLLLYPIASLGFLYSIIKFIPTYVLNKNYSSLFNLIYSSVIIFFIVWIGLYFIIHNLGFFPKVFEQFISLVEDFFNINLSQFLFSNLYPVQTPRLAPLYDLIWVSILISILFVFFNSILIALKKFKESTLADLFFQFSKIIFFIPFLFYKLNNAFFIYLANTLGYLGGMLLSLFFVFKWFKSIKQKFSLRFFSIKNLAENLKFGFPFTLNSLIEPLVAQMDVLLIAYFLGNMPGAVAGYAIISAIIKNIAPIVLSPIYSSQQVILVEENEKNSALFKKISISMTKWISYLGLAVLGFFVVFGKFILLIIAPAYSSLAYLFWFFVPFIVADLLSASARMALFAKGHLKILLFCSFSVFLCFF